MIEQSAVESTGLPGITEPSWVDPGELAGQLDVVGLIIVALGTDTLTDVVPEAPDAGFVDTRASRSSPKPRRGAGKGARRRDPGASVWQKGCMLRVLRIGSSGP
jgi:hypothetical protein